MYVKRTTGPIRDSLAGLEAQLIALSVLDESANDDHNGPGDDDDSSICSSSLGSNDNEEEGEQISLADMSDDEDDTSVATTQSQTHMRLSKTRDSAAALLDREMERLQEQQKIQLVAIKPPMVIKRMISDRRLAVREMSDRRLVREERA